MPAREISCWNSFAPATKGLAAPLRVSLAATFVYDGDGRRVAQTINGVTTYFVGNYYEVTGATVTKYYYAGSSRVAMKVGSTVFYLLTDHLGSTSLTTDAGGNVVSELRYSAWGSVRYSGGATTTNYQFNGQYSYSDQFGLLYFNARWVDPQLGRFSQADSLIPEQTQGTQAWDRYAFVNNNPARYTDPSGHRIDDGCRSQGCNLTPLQRDRDAQQSAILVAQTNARSCAAGNSTYCSGWDNWAWDNLPSAIGTHQGITLLIGAGLEFSASAELSTVFNWRSGQLTTLFTYSIGGYEGTPHGLSLIKYGGITTVRGASDNKYLGGPAAFAEVSASADAIGVVGISGQRSQALDSSGSQFIDPQSKMPIDIGQASAAVGVNLTPNSIDAGLTAGQSNSIILREINIYSWFRQ